MCSSIQTLTRTGASSCPRRIVWWGGLPSGPTAIQVRDLTLTGARVALAVVGGFEKFQRNYSVAGWISRRSPRWSLFLSALPCTRAEMSGWSSGCGCSFLEKNRKALETRNVSASHACVCVGSHLHRSWVTEEALVHTQPQDKGEGAHRITRKRPTGNNGGKQVLSSQMLLKKRGSGNEKGFVWPRGSR